MTATLAPVAEKISPRDIIDVTDIRTIGGVTNRRSVIRWRQDPTFPKPIRTTGGGVELFDRRAVRKWLKDTGRR